MREKMDVIDVKKDFSSMGQIARIVMTKLTQSFVLNAQSSMCALNAMKVTD